MDDEPNAYNHYERISMILVATTHLRTVPAISSVTLLTLRGVRSVDRRWKRFP